MASLERNTLRNPAIQCNPRIFAHPLDASAIAVRHAHEQLPGKHMASRVLVLGKENQSSQPPSKGSCLKDCKGGLARVMIPADGHVFVRSLPHVARACRPFLADMYAAD